MAESMDAGFIVVVDSREQLPFEFRRLIAGADKGYAPLLASPSNASRFKIS